MKNRCLTLENVFSFFDIDDDSIISIDDFEKTLRGTLNIDCTHHDTINLYNYLTDNQTILLNDL